MQSLDILPIMINLMIPFFSKSHILERTLAFQTPFLCKTLNLFTQVSLQHLQSCSCLSKSHCFIRYEDWEINLSMYNQFNHQFLLFVTKTHWFLLWSCPGMPRHKCLGKILTEINELFVTLRNIHVFLLQSCHTTL